ncbi:MAG: hypothetical protein GY756_28110, partial [bacterium]|nr:hypothetical protein [bacterium]
DEEIIRKAKRSSPYGYIVKPFEKRKLLLDIEIALNTINLEKRIKYREELFSATINSITDAVIVTDQNNLIKFMNYIARSMLVNPDVLNKNFMTVYKIDFDNEKNRGKFKDRNGKSRILGIQKSKLKSKLSGKGCYVWVLRDITIPVFLESQLRESQKMEAIGRLAGGVAHDFNNLLTVILGYCSLILDNNESSSINDDLLNDITGIQLTSQKAVRLTKQLLTFTANQVHNPRYVDLNSIIYALNQIKEKLLPDEIQFNISLTSGKTIINVDPVQIEQVLINLIINSRDAISGLGEIDINTSIIDTESYNNSFINLLTGEYIK